MKGAEEKESSVEDMMWNEGKAGGGCGAREGVGRK